VTSADSALFAVRHDSVTVESRVNDDLSAACQEKDSLTAERSVTDATTSISSPEYVITSDESN
jgi:hypothetical protein